MKKYLAIGATLTALSTPALAQDTKHFDGGFAGAEIGVFGSSNLTASSQNQSGTDYGLYYGGTIGYRVQSNSNIVYGIEGAFGKSDVDFTFLGDETDFDLEDVIDHQWHVMGTVGWVTGAEKRDLFSIGAGYSEIKLSPFTSSFSDGGIAAQVAYERAMGNNLSFRVRAMTYEFDSYVGTAGLSLRF